MLSNTEKKMTIACPPTSGAQQPRRVSRALCLLAPVPHLCLSVLSCSLFTLRSGIQVQGE